LTTDQARPDTRRLRLQVVGDEGKTSKAITLQVVGRAVIGRASDETTPELDLTPFGGAAAGVSRVHAAFVCEGGAVYVEDLDSTSGTRINGFSLTPQQRYKLRDSDEVEFGRVRVTVRF
jgi:pSer/pThr/pTyr-binding forkhead associated (FHA) protein